MKLHNYQRRAVAWLGEHHRSILAIEMGLGKTASVLHYLEAAGVTDAVIIAPKRVAETVWRQEAEKWGLSIADRMTIVSGTKDTRPPVLFGKPQPADGILTLSGDIRLRFSEAIAGRLSCCI